MASFAARPRIATDAKDAVVDTATDTSTDTGARRGGGIGPITVIANRKSGTNARDSQAIRRAIEVFEADPGIGEVTLLHWSPGGDRGNDSGHNSGRKPAEKPADDLNALIDRAEAGGARTIVAAGGDGTVMAVAGAMR